MGGKKLIFSSLVLVSFFCCLNVKAADFSDEIERDFPLRTIGRLQITNLRGGITVQGWALDKIRVKAVRRVVADSQEEAKKLFEAMDFRFSSVQGDIELSAQYGRGLDIQQRLKERQNPRTGMEMIIFAPANLKLSVWAIDAPVSVKEWAASVEIRTSSGPIQISGIRAGDTSVLCQSCSISAKKSHGSSLRCMAGTGDVELSELEEKTVYIETSGGAQRLNRITGEQLYVSKDGNVSGKDLRGKIEFHTQGGAVDIKSGSGFVSGRTESGNISIEMIEWKFSDKAIIETQKGDVILVFPNEFSGEIDLSGGNGKVSTDFPYVPFRDPKKPNSPVETAIRGRIADGGEQFKVFSRDGRVDFRKRR